MPSFATNSIKASYNGKSTSLTYWAEGNGRRVEGCTTSLAQLKTNLSSKFCLPQLALYTVVDTKLRSIVSDKHLLTALSRVQKGGTLLLNVYEHQPIWNPPHRPPPARRQPSTARPHSSSSTSSNYSATPVQHTRNKHNANRSALARNTNVVLIKPARR